MIIRPITTFILVLIFSSFAHADFNGYYWLKSNSNSKGIYLAGFLAGYKSGRTLGTVEGIFSTSKTLQQVANAINEQQMSVPKNKKDGNDVKILNLAKDFSSCSKSIDNNLTLLISSQVNGRDNINKDIQYYSDEIDSFLQTFPLCKGKDITEILTQLMMVWSQSGDKPLTYKDIGDQCSK